MLDTELLHSVATQLLTRDHVEVSGNHLRVCRSSSRLRIVNFTVNGHEYEAIEQNPNKPSRWGQGIKSCSSRKWRRTALAAADSPPPKPRRARQSSGGGRG